VKAAPPSTSVSKPARVRTTVSLTRLLIVVVVSLFAVVSLTEDVISTVPEGNLEASILKPVIVS